MFTAQTLDQLPLHPFTTTADISKTKVKGIGVGYEHGYSRGLGVTEFQEFSKLKDLSTDFSETRQGDGSS